jgi:hypothetical protein
MIPLPAQRRWGERFVRSKREQRQDARYVRFQFQKTTLSRPGPPDGNPPRNNTVIDRGPFRRNQSRWSRAESENAEAT